MRPAALLDMKPNAAGMIVMRHERIVRLGVASHKNGVAVFGEKRNVFSPVILAGFLIVEFGEERLSHEGDQIRFA
jgi:hypothetical protein